MTADTQMKAHAAIARALADNGIKDLFGLIGDANLYMVDSFVRDLTWTVAADLHRVEPGRRGERELLRGRTPVAAGEAAEEPPQHPDVH